MTNDKSNEAISKKNSKRGKFLPVSKVSSSSSVVSKVNPDQAVLKSSQSQAQAPKTVRAPQLLDPSSERVLQKHHYEIQQPIGTGAFSQVRLLCPLQLITDPHHFAGILCRKQ